MRDTREITIEAGRTEAHYWRDVWRYRELFLFLSWRDILVRYKQTFFGVAWSVIRPLLTMVVFTIVFNKVARMEAPADVPYAVMVYAAMLPWQFFSNAFSEASNSLVANANLLTKVYFPRLIVPISTVIVSLVDFMISFLILVGLMAWYRFAPSPNMLALPLFLALSLFVALGAGLLVAAMNVKYRDFRYVIPFLVQFGLYISPVGFSSSVVPDRWRLVYSLNPMVGVIEGFRWSILGGESRIYMPGFILSIAVTVALCASGIWYFRRTEKSIADNI